MTKVIRVLYIHSISNRSQRTKRITLHPMHPYPNPRKDSPQISPNCPQLISFMLSFISGTFPSALLITNNMRSKHEGDKNGADLGELALSGVRELFRFLLFMVLT